MYKATVASLEKIYAAFHLPFKEIRSRYPEEFNAEIERNKTWLCNI